MCKTKSATDATEPRTPTRTASRTSSTTRSSTSRPSARSKTPKSQSKSDPSTSAGYSGGSSFLLDTSRTTTSISSRTSLSSLRDTLPENPHIYDFSEIRSATNNFLAKRYSSSSTPSWRCTLRGKDVVVFQRKFRRSIELSQLRDRLSVICRSHHTSIIKLLGVSISGDHIYLVYDFVKGASVSDCLRPKNPEFTVLSTWMSRMQILTDLAHGLDYIHNNTGLNISLVHKHIKSSSIIVTEPSFNAKICHFGAAELCGETAVEREEARGIITVHAGEIEEEVPESPPRLKRSDSRVMQFEGVRGYMSPEFQKTGIGTQKSDVYAFGIVILELMSGEEPLRYKFDRRSGNYRKISVVESARAAIEGGGGASSSSGGGGGGEAVGLRLRRWVDRRLSDSFPVDAAEKLVRVALECVHVDADKRPGMQRVAGKISKLYLDSRIWTDSVRVPTEITASFAPR